MGWQPNLDRGLDLIRNGEYFAAHEAGFDQVVVKSALVERAEDLVQELTASVD